MYLLVILNRFFFCNFKESRGDKFHLFGVYRLWIKINQEQIKSKR